MLFWAQVSAKSSCFRHAVTPGESGLLYFTNGAIRELVPPKNERTLAHFSPPGTGKGTITFTGKGQVTYDIPGRSCLQNRHRMVQRPGTFRARARGANLNSLMFAAAYDFRWLRKPNFGDLSPTSRIIFRKPQLQLRSGPEMSPSRPGTASTTGHSRDWNYYMCSENRSVFRLCSISTISRPRFPSIPFLVASRAGISRLTSRDKPHLSRRGWRRRQFALAIQCHTQHLGSTPITFEAQYRVRWLAYAEPFADFANLPPPGTPPPCPNRVGIGVMTSSTMYPA